MWERILEGPILKTMLVLAWPVIFTVMNLLASRASAWAFGFGFFLIPGERGGDPGLGFFELGPQPPVLPFKLPIGWVHNSDQHSRGERNLYYKQHFLRGTLPLVRGLRTSKRPPKHSR